MTEPVDENTDPVRRHYAFALRDEIPLPGDGWRVVKHAPECWTPNSEAERLECTPANVPWRHLPHVSGHRDERSFEPGHAGPVKYRGPS